MPADPAGPAAPGPGWLVVVDMQVVFADPASPWATPGFDTALAGVQRLVAGFPGRVAYTRFVPPAVVTGAWREYYRQWPFALDPAAAASFRLVDALPPGDAPVLASPSFGKWGPRLRAAVGGSRDVVLAGVSTDCCVLSTALGAVDDGVRVRVAADACRGLSDADHDRALAAMALYAPLVEVCDTADVLAARPA